MAKNRLDEYTYLRQLGFTGTLAEMRVQQAAFKDPTGRDTAAEVLLSSFNEASAGVQNWDLPTAYKGQSCPRANVQSETVLATGVLYLSAIWLEAGDVVTTVTFHSGATALATPSHGWGALFDSARVLLQQSANDTSIAWAADTAKSFTLAAAHTATYSGWHYAGVMVVATTLPTVCMSTHAGEITALAPAKGGLSTGSLTTTAPATAAAPTGSLVPYATWA